MTCVLLRVYYQVVLGRRSTLLSISPSGGAQDEVGKELAQNRVVKCDVTNFQICKIMKFDQLFRGSMPRNVHLPKISSPL